MTVKYGGSSKQWTASSAHPQSLTHALYDQERWPGTTSAASVMLDQPTVPHGASSQQTWTSLPAAVGAVRVYPEGKALTDSTASLGEHHSSHVSSTKNLHLSFAPVTGYIHCTKSGGRPSDQPKEVVTSHRSRKRSRSKSVSSKMGSIPKKPRR